MIMLGAVKFILEGPNICRYNLFNNVLAFSRNNHKEVFCKTGLKNFVRKLQRRIHRKTGVPVLR